MRILSSICQPDESHRLTLGHRVVVKIDLLVPHTFVLLLLLPFFFFFWQLYASFVNRPML